MIIEVAKRRENHNTLGKKEPYALTCSLMVGLAFLQEPPMHWIHHSMQCGQNMSMNLNELHFRRQRQDTEDNAKIVLIFNAGII